MARKKYKPLPWDSRYLISSCGEVISIHTGKRKKLRLQKHRNGHLRIQIEKKHYPVHRLVLETWVGPQPEEKPLIRHMNDVHSDSRVENLQWGTNKQNSRDAKEIKAKKKDIIKRMRTTGFSEEDIAILSKIPVLKLAKNCI